MITFLTAFNLLGIFVFGISGAIAGIKHNADIFGVTVLSLVVSSTRGSMRDLSIGTIPPSAERLAKHPFWFVSRSNDILPVPAY